LHKDSISINM